MLVSRTIALAIALLAAPIAADTDIDIKFHKWGELDCSGGELGDSDYIGDMHCYTFDHAFTSFMYKATLVNRLLFYHDDFSDPTCKIIVYPASYCQLTGWTPGMAGATLEQCFNVPEKLGDQPGFNITELGVDQKGPWAKSAGVFCGATQTGETQLAIQGPIEAGSVPYTTYKTWAD